MSKNWESAYNFYKKEPKKIKTEDGWDIVPGVFEWWIKDYYIVEKKEVKEDDK